MVQIAINIITEKKRGRPRPRKGKKGKRQGKSRCKCFICRQAGHWAKECPNRDKPPKMACYKCHQLGYWMALCPQNTRASRSSTKPSLTMVQCNWSSPLQPDRLSQITFMGLEPRVKLDVVGKFQNFLTSYSRAFSSQTCTIWGATGKTITKRSTQALFCCWYGQISSHQFLVVPECPTCLLGRDILTKLGTTPVMGIFPAPKALKLLVTTEEPITPSPIGRD